MSNFGEQAATASATVRKIWSSPIKVVNLDALSLSITTGPGFARTSCSAISEMADRRDDSNSSGYTLSESENEEEIRPRLERCTPGDEDEHIDEYPRGRDGRAHKEVARSREQLRPESSSPSAGVSVVCEDWISSIQEKKLDELAIHYKLNVEIQRPTTHQRPHCPPPGMAAFSESIMHSGVLIPLHPFVEEVLDYYNIAPFQLTPNSFGIVAAFYILYGEVLRVEPTVEELAYFYCLKKLAHHPGFYYLSKWTNCDVDGIGGNKSNMGEWKMRYFFYLSERPVVGGLITENLELIVYRKVCKKLN